MEDNKQVEQENANPDNDNAELSQDGDTGEGKNESTNDGEQGKKDLSGFKTEAKTVDKDDERSKARTGIINSWVNKIATGDAEMDKVPEWASDEVKKALDSVVNKPSRQSGEVDTNALKAQIKDDLAFESKLDAIAETQTQEDIDLIVQAHKTAISNNPSMPKTEALDYAMFKLGINPIKSGGSRASKLPPSGNKTTSSKGVYTMQQLSELPQAEYNKVRRLQARGEVIINP